MPARHLQVVDLGLADYQRTWNLQKSLFDRRLRNEISDVLLLCEHPHTYTVGKNGVGSVGNHLLLNEEELAASGINVFAIDRGGDITYHGPGQIVGYPILNLNDHYRDVHRYLRDLEEVIIRTLKAFGIVGMRLDDITGVWIDAKPVARKICAIGVKVTRWITMHGFALNVNSNLDYFSGIVPCGLSDKGVTSMEQCVGHELDLMDVISVVKNEFSDVFNLDLTTGSLEKLNLHVTEDSER